MGETRDLDDFSGLDAVKCLGCGKLEPWQSGSESQFAAGWRMTKHVAPTWLCPGCATQAQHAAVVATPGYWKPDQVGPNAKMPDTAPAQKPGESWQTEEARAAAAKKAADRAAFAEQVARERAAGLAPSGEPGPAIDLSAATQVAKPVAEPWNWSTWTPEWIEKVLLGWIYRTVHAKPIGTPADIKFSLLSRVGVPDSEALLVPVSQRKSGHTRVLETTLRAHKWAAACILRDDDMLSNAVTGDGTAGASLQKIMEAGKDWRDDEKEIHGELEFRFKMVFLKWIEKGWLKPEPVLKFSPGDSSGIGRDGLPDNCRLTGAAIVASECIRGTPLAAGYDSRLETSTEEQRKAAPDWYKKEWKQGSKAGT